ncbi:MAG: dihydroorotase, partial [Alphaproteobacteria bacterium]|nr:dihydroorotase [Alphaproteobacteria bacterium]
MTQTYDLIVRGGEVANHAGRGMADVGMIDGKIAFIGDLSQASAGETFDATGLTVLPGVIDTQVHFREPGLEWKEDLETGSRAAALGGVVAVFEMPNTNPNTTDPDTMADKLARAKDRMWTDHAFYVGGTHENADYLGELERLPGCCGVKVFMGASTGDLLIADDEGVRKVLSNVRRRATFHSEDEYRLVERRGLARTGDWTSHPEVRDAESAIRSTRRLVGLAQETGARIHVLHVTTKDEMEYLRFHKDVATVEITPQHLTLAAPEAYERLGAYAQMNPPIRSQEHVDALWLWGMQQGVADVLGSDHAPHTKEEKAKP